MSKPSMRESHPELAAQFHPTKNGDLTPESVVAGTNKKLWWKCPEGYDHEWQATGSNRSKGQGCPICSGRKVALSNCMATTHPELAAEFHPTKNGDLTPNDLFAGTGKKLWWKCPVDDDHEWEATGNARTSRGSGCQACLGRIVVRSNCLATTHPELAAEFHPTKNGDLTADAVKATTDKRLWWKCPEGDDHEWEDSGSNRIRGYGCRVCSGRKVVQSNCMATTHPELAAEFHPTKNGNLTPQVLTARTDKRLWWKCAEGDDHEWQATGGNRSRHGRGCPICAGQKAIHSTCMATTHPELAAEFHPTKNGNITPADIMAGTNKKLWWKCAEGDDHEWQATGGNRSSRGSGCPVCFGRLAVPSNCLAATHPELAAEFHPTKNGDLTPQTVTAGTNKKLWWKCPVGDDHEWQAVGGNRVTLGRGCPVCAGQKAVPSNCMATTHPELAAEFHPTKNGDLSPENLIAGTNKKLWWNCPVGDDHEWEATGHKRVAGQGCPICNTGWTIESTRLFVKGLLDSELYKTLDAAEMWVLFQQNGLRSAGNSRRSEFIKALGTGRLEQSDLEDFANGEPSPVDDLISGATDATSLLESKSADSDPADSDVDPASLSEGAEEDDEGLPELSVTDALDALESSVWASADVEAVEFLEASAVRKMWKQAYEPRTLDAALAESERPRHNEAAERPRKKFHDELQAALSMEIPEGYDFRIDGKLIEPVLMQRHVATSVRDRRRVGNWSGTGAGKTLSAVLASRLVEADVTVVCCPNATIGGWKATIENAFPKSRVVTKTLNPEWPAGDGARYLVVNFEAFQQTNSEADVKDLTDATSIDLIVVDEIHYAKQRTDQASARRKLVMGLIAAAAKSKQARDGSDLRVLGMSATPVINNLREGISMIELVTGVQHEDLADRTNIPNAMRVHQKLTTLGTRWMPPYPHVGQQQPRIDITHRLYDVTAVTSGGMASSMLALEQLLLEEKLDTIVEHINPNGGTIIYSEFVNGMVEPIVDHVRSAGFSVGVYNGQDKSGLRPFLDGELDVLVGSSTIGTGVDGLQHVASKLIVACAPWTAAGYEQLIGRLVRTGQTEQVDVVFPLTFIGTEEGDWSYDESNRLNRILYKKTVADAAVDGVVPEGALLSPADAYKEAVAWLERLNAGDAAELIERRLITVPLSSDRIEVERRARSYGDFAKMNGRWNNSASTKTHQRLAAEPEEWENYHTLYQQARKKWTWVPYVEIAKLIEKGSKNLVVADFGCGEDLLGERLRKKGMTVHSFDHVSISEHVTPLDIGEGVPLEDSEIDIAVFSLSLMGKNNGDFLREAARVVAYDGRIHIVETAARLNKVNDIEDRLRLLGFKLTKQQTLGDPEFVHLQARRTDADPERVIDLI